MSYTDTRLTHDSCFIEMCGVSPINVTRLRLTVSPQAFSVSGALPAT